MMRDLLSQRLLVTVLTVLGATLIFLLLRDRSDSESAHPPPCTIWSLSLFLIATEIIDARIAPFVQSDSWLLKETYGVGGVLLVAYPLGPVMVFLHLTRTKLAHIGLDVPCFSSQNILRGMKWGFCVLCVAMILGFLDPEMGRMTFEKYGVRSDNQINQGISGIATEFLKMAIGLIVVSLVEEMIYRGLLYRTLRRRMAPSLATIISALCFMLPHGVVNVLIFSMACGNAILLEKYGSLVPAVLIHAIWNVGLLTAGWFMITLQVNTQTVFGVGLLVTSLIWFYAWATLRIHDHQTRVALKKT
ncbi:MAG: CPBP family intramembrane metalloprotease [Nitrospira sp.]|nr:CPBP family intramembrane metalloprotease [Nitrospira sp.]